MEGGTQNEEYSTLNSIRSSVARCKLVSIWDMASRNRIFFKSKIHSFKIDSYATAKWTVTLEEWTTPNLS